MLLPVISFAKASPRLGILIRTILVPVNAVTKLVEQQDRFAREAPMGTRGHLGVTMVLCLEFLPLFFRMARRSAIGRRSKRSLRVAKAQPMNSPGGTPNRRTGVETALRRSLVVFGRAKAVQ
jgi:hypothetical protein